MTVKIGNIVLDDDLRLDGIEEAPDLSEYESTSFDGTVDILTMPPPAQRELALSATFSNNVLIGGFTLGQIQSIKSIIAAGQPVVLNHHRGTFNVLLKRIDNFINTEDHANPSPDDWCVATIIMREV